MVWVCCVLELLLTHSELQRFFDFNHFRLSLILWRIPFVIHKLSGFHNTVKVLRTSCHSYKTSYIVCTISKIRECHGLIKKLSYSLNSFNDNFLRNIRLKYCTSKMQIWVTRRSLKSPNYPRINRVLFPSILLKLCPRSKFQRKFVT